MTPTAKQARQLRENRNSLPPMPTRNDLLTATLAGHAKLVVDHATHQEFVMNGFRYFCGWHRYQRSAYEKLEDGWVVYTREREPLK